MVYFLCGVAHPGCYGMARTLLEGEAEGAVAAVAAVAGQLLGWDRTLVSDGLAVETGEMLDAQVVDIIIVGGFLMREILAEVEAVSTKDLGQLGDGQVVLHVELRVYAMSL